MENLTRRSQIQENLVSLSDNALKTTKLIQFSFLPPLSFFSFSFFPVLILNISFPLAAFSSYSLASLNSFSLPHLIIIEGDVFGQTC